MGAGYTKLLSYLDVGPEAKEDKLKKKYNSILTAGSIPKKPDLIWKSAPLSKSDDRKNVVAFLDGCDFIHLARMKKQNVLICILNDDPDTVAFATAYFMVLSGISYDQADKAITNALKETELKLANTYKKSLQMLRDQFKPDEIRTQMFKNAGGYSMPMLSEDVSRIYELCGLPKPTDAQIKLENLSTPVTISISQPEPFKNEPNKIETHSNRPVKPERDQGYSIMNTSSKVDTNKIKSDKEDVMLDSKNSWIDPSILGDGISKSSITVTHSPAVTVNATPTPLEISSHSTPPLKPSSPVLVSQTPSSAKQEVTSPPVPHESRNSVDVGLRKVLSQSIHENTANQVNGTVSEESKKDLMKVTKVGTVHVESTPPVSAASVNVNSSKVISPTPKAPGAQERKIRIVRAISKEDSGVSKNIDNYLTKTTMEERKQTRKPIKIVRAYSKVSE